MSKQKIRHRLIEFCRFLDVCQMSGIGNFKVAGLRQLIRHLTVNTWWGQRIVGTNDDHRGRPEGREVWPFIAGNVKKTLKSVGTTCDFQDYVLFDDEVGYIIHKSDESYIEFGRVGNVYAIDVWIRTGSQADKETSGFTRPVAAP